MSKTQRGNDRAQFAQSDAALARCNASESKNGDADRYHIEARHVIGPWTYATSENDIAHARIVRDSLRALGVSARIIDTSVAGDCVVL